MYLRKARSSPTRWMRRAAAFIVGMTVLIVMLPGTAYAYSAGDPSQGFPPCDTQSTSRHNTITMHDPSNGATMGTAYIVYSAGCETEWVTVHSYSPYYSSASIWMQNQTGTDLYETSTGGDPQGVYWTYQLGNMRYQTACGGVQMYNALVPGSGYVNWNYLGCY